MRGRHRQSVYAADRPLSHIGRSRRQRGAALIELMVASLLLTIGIMALVNMWVFSMRLTIQTDDKAIAYNLGRQAMERVKMAGFTNAAEGTSTTYYNGNQVQQAGAGTARFSVTTSVVSDSVKSGTAGQAGAVPADAALRTVTITVRLVNGGTTQYTTSTYLVRAGI